MGRLILGLCAVTLFASGCQQAKMRSVPPKQAPKAAEPGVYEPPVWDPPDQPVIETPPPRDPVVEPSDDDVVINTPPQTPVTPIFQPPAVTVITPPVEASEPVCGEGGACPEVAPVAGRCEPVGFTGENAASKLDVLFVVDTSASLRGIRGNKGELEQIGRDLGNFLTQLNDNIEFNVAVMLGHGPASRDYHGKIYKRVLKYEDYRSAGGQGSATEKKRRIAAAMARDLEEMLKDPANERGGAQGEALLYSLFTALDKQSNYEAIVNQGMFRQDAALTLVMVSDEQDVCYDYAAHNVTPLMINGAPDPIEVRFFEQNCKTAANGAQLTEKIVYDTLVTRMRGKKLNVYAIAYEDANLQSDPDFRANPDKEDENERGYGIIDFVGLHNGKIVDLKNVVRSEGNAVSFANELAYLGQDTNMVMSYHNPFRCRLAGIHPDAVDVATVKVSVNKADGTTIARFGAVDGAVGSARAQALTQLDRRFLQVELEETKLQGIFSSNRLSSGTFNVEFMTKRGIDPSTGRRAFAND